MSQDSVAIEVKGLKEVQEKMARLVAATGAGKGLDAIIARATLRAHRYASMVVHVDTGRLKNSLHPRVEGKGNNVYGVVGTNVVYAPYEHARGGSHAFFARTIAEDGPGIVRQIREDLKKSKRRIFG